jgi:hypothetical protein
MRSRAKHSLPPDHSEQEISEFGGVRQVMHVASSKSFSKPNTNANCFRKDRPWIDDLLALIDKTADNGRRF